MISLKYVPLVRLPFESTCTGLCYCCQLTLSCFSKKLSMSGYCVLKGKMPFVLAHLDAHFCYVAENRSQCSEISIMKAVMLVFASFVSASENGNF